MTTDESGGRTQQLLTFLKLLPAVVFLWTISFMVYPVKTLRETYWFLNGDYESFAASTTGLDYQHDHIDELWMQNRGGDGE